MSENVRFDAGESAAGAMNREPALWLISAPRGAGKSVFCRAAAQAALAAGCDVAGLVSPAVFENGVKIGIDVWSPRLGEARRLAQAQPGAGFDIPTINWHFSGAALDWGNGVLATSLPCELLIVDEIGPLELERGLGWGAALPALRSGQYALGFVVIRPELADLAQELLPIRGLLPLPKAAAAENVLAYVQEATGTTLFGVG